MKINRKLLVLTSILCLLPIFLGLFYWKALPAEIPTHFDFSGQADGYSSKAEAVFFLPLFMVGIHVISIFMTSVSPKSQNIGSKGKILIYWLVPMIAIPVQVASLLSAMNIISSKELVIGIGVLLSLLFIVIGNYMPKIKQNYVFGIKLPWTLDNEENWYKTHRFAGKVWVACGVLFLLDILFQFAMPYVLVPTFLVMLLAPLVYSYHLYKDS